MVAWRSRLGWRGQQEREDHFQQPAFLQDQDLVGLSANPQVSLRHTRRLAGPGS
jgi:hypothetical protein